jgi:hypothetical protein
MRKGFSANDGGRPPKSRNLITLFKEKRDEKVDITVPDPSSRCGKRAVQMTRLEAWVTNLWNKAIACDPKASAMLLTIMRAIGDLDPENGETSEMSTDDAAVLDVLIKRLSGGMGAGSDG